MWGTVESRTPWEQRYAFQGLTESLVCMLISDFPPPSLGSQNYFPSPLLPSTSPPCSVTDSSRKLAQEKGTVGNSGWEELLNSSTRPLQISNVQSAHTECLITQNIWLSFFSVLLSNMCGQSRVTRHLKRTDQCKYKRKLSFFKDIFISCYKINTCN